MWKARPVVASRIGGIQDQITDGVHGLLVEPTDLSALNAAIKTILEDPALAERLGANARQRVVDDFLGVRHLVQYALLMEEIEAEGSASGAPLS